MEATDKTSDNEKMLTVLATFQNVVVKSPTTCLRGGKEPHSKLHELAYVDQLIFRQQTDKSAHLDKRSKQHYASSNSRFDLHSHKTRFRSFRNHHGYVVHTLFTV